MDDEARKPVLTGEVPLRVRDLVREICGEHDMKIMKGHVSKDYVHLLVSIPPGARRTTVTMTSK